MPRLLVLHHTVSPALHALTEAATQGASTDEVEAVEVVTRPALLAGAVDALEADGYVLGTPANIGYMSGALKHFFDQCYYPCLGATGNRPYALWVHGESDTAGAVRSVELVASALGWRRVHLPVSVVGAPRRSDLEAVRELAATVAATLALEMT